MHAPGVTRKKQHASPCTAQNADSLYIPSWVKGKDATKLPVQCTGQYCNEKGRGQKDGGPEGEEIAVLSPTNYMPTTSTDYSSKQSELHSSL